jgi:nitrogen fixation NifU-like protein
MSTLQTSKEAILDHHRNPRNYGELSDPDVYVREDNPLCGDEVAFYMRFDGARQLTEIRFTGRGCSLAIATASMLTEKLVGRPWQALQQIDEAQLREMLGVEIRPMRMKCVRLSLDVLRQGLALYERGAGERVQDSKPRP